MSGRPLSPTELDEVQACVRALIELWVPSPDAKTDAEVARRLAVSESLIRWARS